MADFSERERAIARLSAAGYAPDGVAQALSLSIRTVENHLYALYAKLGITSSAELAAAIVGEGLIAEHD